MAVLKELSGRIDPSDKKKATLSNCYGKYLLNEQNEQKAEIFKPYVITILKLMIRAK